MSHPRWCETDPCCEHAGTEHCKCRAYYPARTPMKKQVGDSLFRKDNDMREATKAPIREPKAQTYEFPTEIGDFQVSPVYGGWQFSPSFNNGGDSWSEDDGEIYETAREALAAAVRWAQENYDGAAVPAEIGRVAPHWDRPGTRFNPGGWVTDNFLFHTLQEAIEYASKPPMS